MEALLEGLNDAQRSAVTTPASVVQVLAPPGSGKTKTLTARVAYLINHERLKPWNIVVCTFTIKAAREMKERIRGMVGDGIESKLILGTFHSVARRFLVRYGQEIGIEKNFGIADATDTRGIIKKIIKEGDYSVDPKKAGTRISGMKAKGISAEQFAATSKNVDDNEFACVYSSYEEKLRMMNLLDYDDLLLRCVDLLRKSPTCVCSIEAVLIDEYQDTNNVQYELMTLMAQRMRRITIVGDPDQSIYSFRSAEIKNLYRMQAEYPDSLVINLENNYRSSGCILSSAMAVIEQDETRPEKALQATHVVGEQPTLRHLRDAHTEARWIVQEIKRSKTLTAGILNFNDYAILLRSAALSLSIERELGRAGIPYRMVGGKRFFDRAEIKLILDYLRVIDQPNNSDALARIINTPSRQVGEKTVAGLLEEAESRKATLWSMVDSFTKGAMKLSTKVSAQAEKGLILFAKLIRTARQKLNPKEGEECNLFDLITYVMNHMSDTPFQTYLKKVHKENWEERWANVEELIGQATQMATNNDGVDDALPVVEGIEQRPDTAADILSKFLANVALSTEVRADGEENEQVTISTIHAAKGLEWPIVFIPAVYEGSIPHSRAEDHDEERRLLYVGMTRAQALLYLSCPVKQAEKQETTLSRFVSSSDMQKFFSAAGPSIGCTTISDFALILRRPCPSQIDVDTARKSLERIEDDEYPWNREEADGDGPSWGSYDARSEPQSKRRKLDSSNFASSFISASTMQAASSFSTANATLPSGNTGFTTARTQHKIIQEAQAVGALISASSLSAGQTAYRKTKLDVKEEKTVRGKAVKPRAVGQGAITSFFSRPTGSAPQEPDVPAPKVSLPKVPSLARSSSSSYKPLNDISNVQPRPTRPYQVPAFSTHRPRNAPMTMKPKKPDPDEEGTRHIFLSSSPVKPDHDEPIPPPMDLENDNTCEPSSPSKLSTGVVTSSFSGFRSASTFHTTSIGQLQSGSGQTRKTLGTRRSVQSSWSVKHQQIPRPR